MDAIVKAGPPGNPAQAELEALLAETADHPPCGPNLEYDLQFVALADAARGKPEQQIGSTIIPAEQPDWGRVRQQAEALLTRSKDLRVAVLLTRALTRIDNLTGLRTGLRLLHGLLERYWEEVHPVPDPDDPDDIITRLNTLAPLVDADAVLMDVRSALVVVSGPHGRVSVRDILVAAGRLSPADGETVPGQAQIESALASAAAENPDGINAVRDCFDAASAIHVLLADRVGSDRAMDLRPLSAMLKLVMQACSAAVGHSPVASVQEAVDMNREASPDSIAPVAVATGAQTGIPNDIRSREDAMRALDAVCAFYEYAEPGNPAPLLIRRAQRLMNKSFVEIMQDLAPDSLEQIRHIAGLKNE
jgi:type VI secretion system protein ImpA